MGLISNLTSRLFNISSSAITNVYRFGGLNSNYFKHNESAYLREGYEQNIDVYSVISRITDVASSIPWVIERKTSDGWEVVEDTELHALLANPNPSKGYTWSDIQRMSLIYLLSTGNAFQLGIKPLGFNQITELDVLPSNLTQINSNRNWLSPEIQYQFQIETQKFTFSQEDVNHVKYFNPLYTDVNSSLRGMSPIQAAARAVQVGNDRWDADANLLQNRGTMGILTDKSNEPMTPEEAKKMQEAYDSRNSGTKHFGKVRVTNKDLNYISMAMSSADLQLIEKGVITTRAICNVYGAPSELFNDPENKTHANREEAKKSFYTDSIMPINNMFQEDYNRWLIPAFFSDAQNWRMRADYSNVEALQEDLEKKARTVSVLKASGIITANDARMKLNIEPSEDENADKLITSSSNVLLEDLNREENETE